jgi:hypothetical protein
MDSNLTEVSYAEETTFGASAAGVRASGRFTLTGQPANTETITVAGVVYTFQTVLTNVARNVFIGASAAVTMQNLIAAINLAAGAGTKYAAATIVNANVSAVYDGTGGVHMDVTAKLQGTAANALATTDTVTNGSWAHATLTGGVAPAYTNLQKIRFRGSP